MPDSAAAELLTRELAMVDIKPLQGSIDDLMGVMASASARQDLPPEVDTLVRTAELTTECRSHIVVEDVQTDAQFAPYRRIALSDGFRAAQSMPLFSRGRALRGVISMHFKYPHRPTERQLRLTDLYLQQVAEIIERKLSDDEHAKLLAVIDLNCARVDPHGTKMTFSLPAHDPKPRPA